MSVMNLQVFFGGLLNRAGVVFIGEKTTFLNHKYRELPSQMVQFYFVLLNPATKVDPDTAEVKVDQCLLNF